MAPVYSQRRQNLPVYSSADNHGGDRSGLPCSVPLTVLTINSINTIYRASVNGDSSMVIFIVFVYLAYLVLDYCLTELGRSPPVDEGPRRETLKLVAWVFSTMIGFSFAYHFSQLASMWMAVVFYSLAAASSGLVLYFYFCCDHRNHHRSTWCRVEKIDVEFVFDRAKKTRADTKSTGDLSAAVEIV